MRVHCVHDALLRFGRPEILNTYPESQFTAEFSSDVLLDRGIKIGIGGRNAGRS